MERTQERVNDCFAITTDEITRLVSDAKVGANRGIEDLCEFSKLSGEFVQFLECFSVAKEKVDAIRPYFQPFPGAALDC